jgi:hypothetical protein
MNAANRALLLTAQEFLFTIYKLTKVECVIAGGFVRDMILDRPYRDIDLYVQGHSFGSVFTEITGERPNWRDAKADESSAEYLHQAISHQQEVTPLAVLLDRYKELLTGHPVNIIGLRGGEEARGEDVVSRFNFGICQAWISMGGSGTTDEFRKDAARKHITLLRTDWGREASMRQYEKLSKKYEWPLIEREYVDAVSRDFP